MPSKKPEYTHSGIVVTNDGRERVSLRMTPTTWCAKGGKYYFREDGRRGGHTTTQTRLLLDTIRPLKKKQPAEGATSEQ